MDTGAYMANQMDDLITASLLQYDTACDDLVSDIELYINECNYTWTIDSFLDEYRNKYKNGFYISHSCKQIVEKFKDRLELLRF